MMITKKYFDVHMHIDNDSKEGYSIFLMADSIKQALDIIRREALYEDEKDLNNIDYIGEITEQEFKLSNMRK
ncbi:hypothetical protein [uncultured Ruminococcus sp.]|uniref:hypothetical protein n=1 Tax=uncultured Ruminococcus sp. TaxID=165186 RepID=UPI002930A750|nr:hypothetical protein [uncultured Ruminococcus sp.]